MKRFLLLLVVWLMCSTSYAVNNGQFQVEVNSPFWDTHVRTNATVTGNGITVEDPKNPSAVWGGTFVETAAWKTNTDSHATNAGGVADSDLYSGVKNSSEGLIVEAFVRWMQEQHMPQAPPTVTGTSWGKPRSTSLFKIGPGIFLTGQHRAKIRMTVAMPICNLSMVPETAIPNIQENITIRVSVSDGAYHIAQYTGSDQKWRINAHRRKNVNGVFTWVDDPEIVLEGFNRQGIIDGYLADHYTDPMVWGQLVTVKATVDVWNNVETILSTAASNQPPTGFAKEYDLDASVIGQGRFMQWD